MREHLFYGDALRSSGLWGPPTSKLNFCEEDYVITTYLAEFINTLSNLAYVYYGLPQPGQPRMDFMSWSLIGVGICSGIYHATLLQYSQCGDDLSMLVFTGAMVQACYTAHQKPSRTRWITLAIFSAVLGVSVIYLLTWQTWVHRGMFTLLLLMTGPRVHYLIKTSTMPEHERKRLWRRYLVGLFAPLAGYTLWNVELFYCFEMREMRRQMGLPWSWALEFHGYWHILTAVGAGEFIKLIRTLREERTVKKVE